MSKPIRADAGPFRSFVEAAADLFTVVDLSGRIRFANPASRRILGLSPEECLGKSAFDFVHPDDLERTRAEFARWLTKADALCAHIENRQVNAATGEVFHLHWTIAPELDDDGQLLNFASVGHDVTTVRRIERELEAKELRLRSLVAGMLDALVTIDPRGTIQEASESCRTVFGWSAPELVGRNVSVLMPEPHRSQHDEYLARYRRTGNTWILNTTRVFECVHKNGSAVTCELSVSRIDVPGAGEPLFCGIFRDVTARVRAERAIAESERRFRAVFEQEFQYVGILSPEGAILEVNQAVVRATGVRADEVRGLPFWEAPWWRHGTEQSAKLRAAVSAAAKGEIVRLETQASTVETVRRSIDFSVKAVRGEDGSTALLVAEGRDITALRRAQERETSMLRALASVGESASILAHEIKNPITAVNAALRAVAKELGEDEQLILAELVERMQKLERLIRRTLSFAKPIDLDVREIDARRIFDEVAALLAPEFVERGATLAIDDADAPHLLVDPELVDEVLLNLVRNALEAGAHQVRLGATSKGDGRVLLTVEDDGPGIAESVLPRLFEPFVTNKPNGTGIGLALCKKIAEQHGGTIRALSGKRGGTRFELELPALRP